MDNSTRNCIRKIEQGDADIIVLDAGDVYEAGRCDAILSTIQVALSAFRLRCLIIFSQYNNLYWAFCRYHNLVPIANENYGDTGSYYYAVAVSRQTESHLTLFNLIARNSCHGSMRSASGWIYPVLSLIETGQILPAHCDAIKRVGT